VFRILKRVFGFDKVRYRGIAKNHHRLCANFALVNLYLHRKRLAVLNPAGTAGSGKAASNMGKLCDLCRSGIPRRLKIDGCSEVP
jgi:hypothetical protein